MTTICNICSGTVFKDFNGRQGVQCVRCESLERHRIIRWVLQQLGYLSPGAALRLRVLHLAPEAMSHSYLSPQFGTGYICSDYSPHLYPHAKCLKLRLPDGFGIFPQGYFDLVLHNHVLEHIPGDFRDHLKEFNRLLASGGRMIFTIPYISPDYPTIQGGENLSSNADRTRIHGQMDHYKTFGNDFLEYFKSLPGDLRLADIPDSVRQALKAPKDNVYIWQKAGETNVTVSCKKRTGEFETCRVIATSGMFDTEEYLKANPDVRMSGLDPVIHYVRYGEAEGRSPSKTLSVKTLRALFSPEDNLLYQYIQAGKQHIR